MEAALAAVLILGQVAPEAVSGIDSTPEPQPPGAPAQVEVAEPGRTIVSTTHPDSAQAVPMQRAQPPVRVHTGMWTVHFRDMGRGVDANHLVGVTWRRWYAVTFTNSFDERAFSAGLERTPLSRAVGPARVGLGYRAGFVTGYDERFHRIAARTPVVPVVQLRAAVDTGPVGLEWAWAGIVASLSLNFRM